MTAALRPFLRSPPFPWVSPESAAVSVPGRSSLADPDATLALLRRARVGGAFWTKRDRWTSMSGDPADPENEVIDWLSGRTTVDSIDIRRRAIAMLEAARYRDPFGGEEVDVNDAIATLGLWRRHFDANRAIVASVGMARWKRDAIAQFLWDGENSPPFLPADAAVAAATGGGAIAAWPSRSPADLEDQAACCEGRVYPVEDGFLRSTGLGAECRPPLSVLIDTSGGIHFDPTRPSVLETLLETMDFEPELLARAANLRASIVINRLGKYGVDRAMPPVALPEGRRVILAIGQVADDLSVIRGGGGASTEDFLSRVRDLEPDAFIIYRPHPDVVAGLRRGVCTSDHADLVQASGSLIDLFDRVDGVHVLSSQTGFEALLRGVPVTVHGQPFYAGWGLTRDLAPQSSRRRRRLTVDELVAGALLVAPRYIDPVTRLPCEPETLVSRMIDAPVPRHTILTGMRKVMGATRRSFPYRERRA